MSRAMVALCVAGVVVSACGPTTEARLEGLDLSAVLSEAGFSELAMASTGFGPGALVTSRRGRGFEEPLTLEYICDPDFTVTVPVREDRAASLGLSNALRGSVAFTGGELSRLGLDAGARHVESVKLSFTDVHVVQTSHEQLRRIVANLGPVCRETLEEFRDQGIARQTLQALRADVEYEVVFDSGASLDLRNRIVSRLFGQIDGEIERADETRVIGRGLYYGVVLRDVPA